MSSLLAMMFTRFRRVLGVNRSAPTWMWMPQELLAKVSSRVDVKAGDEIKLAMDVTKLHFFDQETGIAINH